MASKIALGKFLVEEVSENAAQILIKLNARMLHGRFEIIFSFFGKLTPMKMRLMTDK